MPAPYDIEEGVRYCICLCLSLFDVSYGDKSASISVRLTDELVYFSCANLSIHSVLI